MEHAAYQWMSKLPEGLFQKIFLKIPLADSPSDLCPLTWFEPIENQVNEQLQLINNNLEASEWSILWSKAGGNEQGKHTDFSKFDFERYAGIISVSGASKLEIGDQSTSDPTELSTISLGKEFCVKMATPEYSLSPSSLSISAMFMSILCTRVWINHGHDGR